MRLVTYGVIRTKAKTPMQERLLAIYVRIRDLLATFEPESAGIEVCFRPKCHHSDNSQSGTRRRSVGAGTSPAFPSANTHHQDQRESVAGYGNADKIRCN